MNENQEKKNWTADLEQTAKLPPFKNKTVRKEKTDIVTREEFELLKKRLAIVEKYVDIVRRLSQGNLMLRHKLNQLEGDINGNPSRSQTNLK